MESSPGLDRGFECVLHFPKLPEDFSDFKFLSVEVELKPKCERSGGIF